MNKNEFKLTQRSTHIQRQEPLLPKDPEDKKKTASNLTTAYSTVKSKLALAQKAAKVFDFAIKNGLSIVATGALFVFAAVLITSVSLPMGLFALALGVAFAVKLAYDYFNKGDIIETVEHAQELVKDLEQNTEDITIELNEQSTNINNVDKHLNEAGNANKNIKDIIDQPIIEEKQNFEHAKNNLDALVNKLENKNQNFQDKVELLEVKIENNKKEEKKFNDSIKSIKTSLKHSQHFTSEDLKKLEKSNKKQLEHLQTFTIDKELSQVQNAQKELVQEQKNLIPAVKEVVKNCNILVEKYEEKLELIKEENVKIEENLQNAQNELQEVKIHNQNIQELNNDNKEIIVELNKDLEKIKDLAEGHNIKQNFIAGAGGFIGALAGGPMGAFLGAAFANVGFNVIKGTINYFLGQDIKALTKDLQDTKKCDAHTTRIGLKFFKKTTGIGLQNKGASKTQGAILLKVEGKEPLLIHFNLSNTPAISKEDMQLILDLGDPSIINELNDIAIPRGENIVVGLLSGITMPKNVYQALNNEKSNSQIRFEFGPSTGYVGSYAPTFLGGKNKSSTEGFLRIEVPGKSPIYCKFNLNNKPYPISQLDLLQIQALGNQEIFEELKKLQPTDSKKTSLLPQNFDPKNLENLQK